MHLIFNYKGGKKVIKPLSMLGYSDSSEYMDKIINTLSSYTEKFINEDGSVTYKKIKTTYFLENDNWHIDFFGNIEQFKKQYEEYKYANKNIAFNFNNTNINNEMKFIIYNKLFNDKWKLSATIMGQQQFIRRLIEFINEKYPTINSFLELDIKKANIKWIDWLENKGIKAITTSYLKNIGKKCTHKTAIANFLNVTYDYLFNLTDTREEWEKDKWDVRKLERYRVSYNKSKTHYFIDFTKINNKIIRKEVKKYFKQRLLSNNFSWGTVCEYIYYLPSFINLISELEPTWNDLKNLERCHIEKYIEWLNVYTKENLTRKDANPNHYINRALIIIQKFLSDIQLREYTIAPKKSVGILIFPEDKPKQKKKPYDQIDYIPDYVLEQLFNHINNLHKAVIPIVWIMYKTGLRISDVLGLKQDCLVKLNGKYWIVTDIEKTYVEGHRIPIDDELANMLAVLIDKAKENSNIDNNPDNLIFVRYTGSRKGKPYSQGWVQDKLNILAREYNITDESGKLYHFKNHSFRHTYGVKMLNNGADILTVQELLAHASPEMTLRYAKILDDKKRKAHDKVMKSGVFSFNTYGEIEQNITGEISQDILDMLWMNHKLSAIDTPYGTCLQRSKGKCEFAKQPPCLTCNGGKPCKDLGIGIFEGDIKKYEIHINSAKALIEQAKKYNRNEMTKENEELLKIYEEIYNTIKDGNIIYGRLDKLMK